MKFNRIMALLLCVTMLLCVLAGCSKKVDDVIDDYTEDETAQRDMDKARATYDGSEVVLTVNGNDVTWDEYFNWLSYALANYEYSNGQVSNFAEASGDGTMSDVMLDETDYFIQLYKAVEMKAAELGISPAADIDEKLQKDWEDSIANYDSEADLLANVTRFYGTRENYEYIYKIDSLSPDLYAYYFGENAEKLTDEQIAAGTEGYYMAKHILVHTTDEDGNVLDDAGKKAAQEKIEEAYAKLKAYEGDDLEGYFDELIAEYNDDPGAEQYPDGYLFMEGDMVDEFFKACTSVEEGQFSEIVESTYGYHIVMRLPLNIESVPMRLAAYGMKYPLREVIAQDLFSKESESWMDMVQITKTPFYDTIDLAKVFG